MTPDTLIAVILHLVAVAVLPVAALGCRLGTVASRRPDPRTGLNGQIMAIAVVEAQVWAYDLARRLDRGSSAVAQSLRRLKAHGLLIDHVEDVDPREVKRRPRRYYSLTALGREAIS